METAGTDEKVYIAPKLRIDKDGGGGNIKESRRKPKETLLKDTIF